MTAVKELFLCADDFAQDRATTLGILRLAEKGRLSGVSCFADAPLWPQFAKQLADYRNEIAVGLHFNLTRPFGCAERPLGSWLLRSATRSLDEGQIRRSLHRQIDRFADAMGTVPDFIDGHQHVHAFPVVRSILREECLKAKRSIRIRKVTTFFGKTDAPLKRRVIKFMANLGSVIDESDDCWMNSAFAGDYSLSPAARYSELFSNWIFKAPDGALIMCHPTLGARKGPESAGALEFRFLASDEFASTLHDNACRLAQRATERGRPASDTCGRHASGAPALRGSGRPA